MDNTATQSAMQQTQPQAPDPEQILQANNQALIKKRQLGDQQTPPDQAAISQAMAMVNPKGKDTTTQIGKSIQTPAYAGYCLQWVDDQQGNSNRQPTAYADYQVNAKSGNISTSGNIPAGARVYFGPDASNGGMGHVGIAGDDGTFTSATDNGVKTYKISDWVKSTGQSLLGWTKSK